MKKNTILRTNELEVAQNFVVHNYNSLLNGDRIPPIKFIFGEDGYQIFEYLLKNPVLHPEFNIVIERIYQYQIDVMKDDRKRSNGEVVIYVPNALDFFKELSIIANLYKNISKYNSPQKISKEFFKAGLWLRMTPQDFNDIHGFLERQIGFLYNICYLDNLDEIPYDKYIITASNEVNEDMFESFNRMCFTIHDEENEELVYELPSIHYGIVDENYKKVCYIYAIQNMATGCQDKKIARALYHINKGVEKPTIPPAFVLAMKTFIDVLNRKDIAEIRVPLLEVLNYGYHQMITEEYGKRFETEWSNEKIQSIFEENDQYEINHYNIDKKIHDNYVSKEDAISKSKTEVFASIFYRLQEQYDDIDIDVNDFELIIRQKKNKILER